MLTMLTIAAAIAQTLPPPAPVARVRLESAVLPGVGEVWLELRSFATLDRDFRLEVESGADQGDGSVEGAERARAAALESVARSVNTWRGAVIGFEGSHAYLAESPRGRLGIIELAGRRFAVAPLEGSWAGPVRGPSRWVDSPGAGAPFTEEACRVLHAKGEDGDRADQGGVAGDFTNLVRGMRVRMAADADYDFTSIFDSEEDCTAYIVSLYGAMSSIYEREMEIHVAVSYIRLWTTPDDFFNDEDPLYQFRDLWNETQQEVVRDLAQLLTGRRNLPYGGVAWLDAACTDFGYSVAGYLIGSFVDAGRTDPGNWDVIVTTHEVGHNIGTLHTHNYGIDNCANGAILRGGFMSYCHTVSGATANVDLTLHAILRGHIAEYLAQAECIGRDCDGDGVEDSEAIAQALAADLNGDGVPDECQDCDHDGVLDPDEIAAGAADHDGDGVPDECQPDCNSNGVIDVLDVMNGTSGDAWGNLVPDECEPDCNGNAVSDYNEILLDMSRDIDRDARLDECQDCDQDGTLDADVLGSSRHWWVSSSAGSTLRELHPRSGVKIRESGPGPSSAYDLALSSDGLILGTCGNSIAKWSPISGDFTGFLVPPGGASLAGARGLLVMPDGSLVVASSTNASVIKYNPNGTSAGLLVQFTGFPPPRPTGLARRADGVIAVSTDDGFVRGYQWPGGALVGMLANLNVVGAGADPSGILFLPDGDLLVASRTFNSIERFDGTTGAHEGRFDVGPNPSSSIALKKPISLRLYADDKVVLATSNANGAPIVGFDATTGYHLRTYRVYPTDAPSANGLLVMPASPLDCNANFLPDSCDVASGASPDSNGDGVPDECQGGPWAPEDLDFDGFVNGADIAILLGNWGFSGVGDADGNGIVGGGDLTLLLGAWTG